MPDPARLHSFLGRAQKALEQALQAGDKPSADMYEQMLDRANALGERFIASGGKPSGPSPVVAGNGLFPGNSTQRDLVPYGQQATQQPPADANYMAGDEPAQQNSASAQQGGGLVPPSGQGQSLVDLTSLQKPTNLKLDLEQEAGPVGSPFAQPKPANPIQGAMDKFGGLQGGGSLGAGGATQPPALPAPTSGNALQSILTEGLPTGGEVDPSIQAFKEGAWNSEPMRGMRYAGDLALRTAKFPGTLLHELGVNKAVEGEARKFFGTPAAPEPGYNPALWEPWSGKAPGPAVDTTLSNYGGNVEKEDKVPATAQQNWMVPERFSNLQGMSPEQQAAHAAEFDRKAEFEKRVLEEHGKAPSFIEQLLGMLLGGMQGLGHLRGEKARYQAGRASVGREMRSEKSAATRQEYTRGMDKAKMDLEQKKANYALLTKAAQMAQKPHLIEAERAQAEIDTILRIPGIAENDPRIVQLKAKMDNALNAANQVSQANFYDRGILK